MFRDLTYSDVNRLEATGEACAEFVMDEESFRAFYDRNARGVWAYLARVTGNRQTADDLLQEAFYRFLRAGASRSGAAERSADFERAMSRLKPRERAMLWLAYAEGASHREIADVLGLSPASLKQTLFRARRRLAVLLGRTEEGNAAR